jgi:hypothetical protein
MDAVRRAAWLKCSIVWLLCVAAAAGVLLVGDNHPELMDETLLEFGGIFAFAVAATRTIGSRLRDLSSLVLIFWGLSFGFWAMPWLSAVGLTIRTGADHGYYAGDLVNYVHMPLTIATAGLATAALLYVGTGCGRVAGQAVFAAFAAAVTPLVPVYQEYAVEAGALVWHAIIAGALCSWGIRQAIEAAGVGCGKCGADVRGLASPVCPSCGQHLRIVRPEPQARVASNLPPTVVTDSRLKF